MGTPMQQQTLHSFLASILKNQCPSTFVLQSEYVLTSRFSTKARPRPARDIARAVVSSFAGQISSAPTRGSTHVVAGGAGRGRVRLERARDGLDESSSEFFDNFVQQGIMVCMCVYVHIHTHKNIHIHLHTYIYAG